MLSRFGGGFPRGGLFEDVMEDFPFGGFGGWGGFGPSGLGGWATSPWATTTPSLPSLGWTGGLGRELGPVQDVSRRLGAVGGLMNVDLQEDEGNFILSADAPGIKKEQTSVKVVGDRLQIDLRQRQQKEGGDATTHWSERYSGHQRRSFPLPENIDRDQIEAKLDQGVLRVYMPKTEEQPSNVKQITIS